MNAPLIAVIAVNRADGEVRRKPYQSDHRHIMQKAFHASELFGTPSSYGNSRGMA